MNHFYFLYPGTALSFNLDILETYFTSGLIYYSLFNQVSSLLSSYFGLPLHSSHRDSQQQNDSQSPNDANVIQLIGHQSVNILQPQTTWTSVCGLGSVKDLVELQFFLRSASGQRSLQSLRRTWPQLPRLQRQRWDRWSLRTLDPNFWILGSRRHLEGKVFRLEKLIWRHWNVVSNVNKNRMVSYPQRSNGLWGSSTLFLHSCQKCRTKKGGSNFANDWMNLFKTLWSISSFGLQIWRITEPENLS